MKEREFIGWILDLAARGGWRVWHVPYPVRPVGNGRFVPEPRAKGLPDLIMLHDDPPRLVFAEVKGPGGKLSEEQVEFLRLARGVADGHRRIAEAVNDLAAAAAEAVRAAGMDAELNTMPALMGVYSWRPGVEALIESILIGKVMIP